MRVTKSDATEWAAAMDAPPDPDEDRELIRGLEAQRAEVGILTLRVRDARIRRKAHAARSDGEDPALERETVALAALEVALADRVCAYEEALRRVHQIRPEILHRRTTASTVGAPD
jgi:hypothetical protein